MSQNGGFDTDVYTVGGWVYPPQLRSQVPDYAERPVFFAIAMSLGRALW